MYYRLAQSSFSAATTENKIILNNVDDYNASLFFDSFLQGSREDRWLVLAGIHGGVLVMVYFAADIFLPMCDDLFWSLIKFK